MNMCKCGSTKFKTVDKHPIKGMDSIKKIKCRECGYQYLASDLGIYPASGFVLKHRDIHAGMSRMNRS
jgi:hypothetical protein